MGAALVGSTLASLGIGEAAADDECKPNGKKCRKNKQCCSGTCSNDQCVSDYRLRSGDIKSEHVHVRVYPCEC